MDEFCNWVLILIMGIGMTMMVLIVGYHIVRMATGAYSAELRDRRIRGLENKLSQYSPHINWRTYKTDEEYGY